MISNAEFWTWMVLGGIAVVMLIGVALAPKEYHKKHYDDPYIRY